MRKTFADLIRDEIEDYRRIQRVAAEENLLSAWTSVTTYITRLETLLRKAKEQGLEGA